MIDQHKSLSEKFIKKGFWLYLFSFIIAPIGYIIKIVISGNISVSDLGILYGIISLITLLSSFNDFGMTESMNYFIPKYFVKKDYSKIKTILAFAFLTQIITGAILASVLFFGADYLSINYFKSVDSKLIIQIFCLYFLGINVFQVFNGFFLVVQNTFYRKVTDFLRMLFILCSVIFVTLLNLGDLITYTISWIAGLYFGIIFVLYFFYTKYYKIYFSGIKFHFSKKLFKKLFSYAILVFLSAQATTILSQIDMQMIIYILGTKDAGYYTNYLSIISIPFMLIGPIFGLLFPIFSELHAKKDDKKIKLIKQIFIQNFTIIAIFFNIFFFVFGPIIAYVLFGEKYIFSGEILRYSILFLVFNFLLQINFNILSGIGKISKKAKIIGIAIIMNIITNIILIKLIGVAGAALATGFGWLFIYAMSEITLGRKYFIQLDYINLFKNLFFIGMLGFFSYYFITPIFEGFNRGISFLILFSIGILWFILFVIINLKSFKSFIGEIKKIKK